FLGTERTGVIADREFSVPESMSEVETLWDQGIGDGWSSFAVAGDRAVTLEQREDLEAVTCYRLSDGELLWMVDHKARHQNALGGVGPRSTPTIVGDRVYAQGGTGTVWCIDLISGETIWTVDLLELAGWDQIESEAAITWGRAGSPLVTEEGLCVVPYGGPELNVETGRSLLAVDAKTGETVWTAGEDQISYASPGLLTLDGEQQIVSVNEKTISGHRIQDGRVLWETDWFGESNGGANCAMAIPAGDNRFLIGKGYGGGSALFEVKLNDGTWTVEPLWESNRILKTKFTHAAVKGDTAYAISNGALEAVAIDSGERLWVQSRRVRFGQGQILLVDDTIIGQTEPGDVVFVAADPSEYRELFRMPALTSKTWNIPTIAGRHLLIRNDRQAICFRLPESEPAAP
ncbi:MAG: PQQ-binding-like beta-propeller repeat protein, partial [Rubripirellula sp.]